MTLLRSVSPSHIFLGLQVVVERLQVVRVSRCHGARHGLNQRCVDVLDHLACDLGLNRKDVVEAFVVAARPDAGGVGHADELRRDAHAALGTRGTIPTNRSLQHVVHTEVLRNLGRRLPGAVVLHGRVPRDDTDPRHGGQPADDLVGDAVGEVLVLGGPQVLERKDDDHLALGLESLRDRVRGRALPPHQSNAYESQHQNQRQGHEDPAA